MEPESLICITCPKGCSLAVLRDGDTVLEAKGGCARGFEYAKREIADPRRMVASTVRIKGALHPLLPVYTSAPIPKPKIRALLDELRRLELHAPVRMGEVVLHGCAGAGGGCAGQPGYGVNGCRMRWFSPGVGCVHPCSKAAWQTIKNAPPANDNIAFQGDV